MRRKASHGPQAGPAASHRRNPACGATDARNAVSAAFDGRKARSGLKWKILGTLLGRAAAPMAAARVYEFIRTGSARNLGEWLHRVRHPSHVYVYLRRMAEEGLVTLNRLDEALVATLTDRGRRELERYSAYWEERGIASPELLAQAQHTGPPPGRPGATDLTSARPAPKAVRPAAEETSSTPAPKRADDAPPGDGPASLAAQCTRRIGRRRPGGRPEGFGGSTGFVSYDLPMPEHGRRRRLLAVLKAAGYSPVHASMYAGPGFALKAVLQTLEGAGFAPHLRWGSLRLMPR